MIVRKSRLCAAIVLLLLTVAPHESRAQARVERNVVYGMYSGLALLMDVHHPEDPKGIGILYVPLQGWFLAPGYGGRSMKDAWPANYQPMIDAGFTVFAINVRASPRFRYPAPLEDARRAVRFIRFHAERFGIRADAIGGWGFSAGAHIVGLLGTLDGRGDPDAPDPVDRVSAKLQCVIAGAMPADLTIPMQGRSAPLTAAVITSFLGAPPFSLSGRAARHTVEIARDASPRHHVSADDAPFLLEHGDADEVIPFEQAELMARALREAGVPVEIRRVPGGDHGGPAFARHDGPDRFARLVGWFDRHLAVGR